MILKLLLFGIWAVLVPLGAGLLFARKFEEIPLAFAGGYMLNWALFQLISVPMIMKDGRMFTLDKVFMACILPVSLAGYFLFIRRLIRLKKESGSILETRVAKPSKGTRVITAFLWLLFASSLLFQLYMSYTMAYADGDDAYYVAHSTASVLGGGMYRLNPYTGLATGFESRHALAPFPMWVAFIALRCDVNAAVAAHSLLPLVLIPLTYVIYFCMGQLLCSEKRRAIPAFMLFVSLLQIFGNYSIYPASTFLLTRSRQGKAALANAVIPFFLVLFLMLGEELKKTGEAEKRTLILMTTAGFAGCLTSTLSGVLTCIMTGLLTGFLALSYKNKKILWQCFLTCLPVLAMVLIMLVKRGGV